MSLVMQTLLAVSDAPSPAWEDDRLVAACVNGDQRAWDALIAKYKRLIYSVILRYHATPEDAADLFQAVCLELFNELERIREPGALRGWLITVTARASLRWRQRRDRREGIERADVDVSALGVEDDRIADGREAIERAQDLRESIARLPERCQAMIRMLFFEDPPRPYAQLAASLGLATGSIGFIRGRCLEKLRKVILEHEASNRNRRR